MALAIKNTPALANKASKRFNQLIESQKNQKISETEKAKMKELVKMKC